MGGGYGFAGGKEIKEGMTFLEAGRKKVISPWTRKIWKMAYGDVSNLKTIWHAHFCDFLLLFLSGVEISRRGVCLTVLNNLENVQFIATSARTVLILHNF